MRIAICDDSIIERSSLYEMMAKYCTSRSMDTAIELFASGEDFLASDPENKYSIILMDIYLKGMNGMDAIKEFRKKDNDAIVIFCTTSSDFAIEGYSVHASNYLVKPVSYKALSDALDSCQNLIDDNVKSIEVLTGRLPMQVYLRSIIYIEVMNSLCRIHTIDGEIDTYRPLQEISDELPNPPFLRCHRSYLVNMNYADEILDRDFLMKDGSTVPISKKEKTRIKTEYLHYIWNKAK